MKFGQTTQTRYQRKQEQLAKLFDPHFWFAWHPVQLKDGRIAFLERVVRTLPIVMRYGHYLEAKGIPPTYEALD